MGRWCTLLGAVHELGCGDQLSSPVLVDLKIVCKLGMWPQRGVATFERSIAGCGIPIPDASPPRLLFHLLSYHPPSAGRCAVPTLRAACPS